GRGGASVGTCDASPLGPPSLRDRLPGLARRRHAASSARHRARSTGTHRASRKGEEKRMAMENILCLNKVARQRGLRAGRSVGARRSIVVVLSSALVLAAGMVAAAEIP